MSNAVSGTSSATSASCALRWVLSSLDYPTKDLSALGTPDPLIVGPPAQLYEQSELDHHGAARA